jgi:hypothetical protein
MSLNRNLHDLPKHWPEGAVVVAGSAIGAAKAVVAATAAKRRERTFILGGVGAKTEGCSGER